MIEGKTMNSIMRIYIKNSILLISACLLSSGAWGYIPPLRLILSRTTDNHGKGITRVTQNVIFSQNNSSFIVKETWLSDGGQKLLLVASGQNEVGQKFQFQSFYQQNSRHFIDASGARKVSKAGDDWFEDLFLLRSSDSLLARLYALNIAPADAIRRQPEITNIKNIVHPVEAFVRLSRSGGKVAYGISMRPPAQEDSIEPGIWIEQDGFVVLKVRLPSQSVITASDYKGYGEGFQLANQKEVQWKNQRVLINTTKVEVFPRTHPLGRELNQNSLDASSRGALVMPAIDAIQEFYNRFR